MSAHFTATFRADIGEQIIDLRRREFSWLEIEKRLGLARSTLRNLHKIALHERTPAVWPLVVTRITENGDASIIRTEELTCP